MIRFATRLCVASLLVLGAAAAWAAPASEPSAPAASEPVAEAVAAKSGAFGWGVGLELPMVGVLTGVASKSRIGAGYTIGAALTYELWPTLMLRTYATWGQTHQAAAAVRYQRSGQQLETMQTAEWLNFELGLGAAYLFRSFDPVWVPYVGVDVGATLVDGFEYRLDETLKDLIYNHDQWMQFDNGRLLGKGISFVGGVRTGMRVELSSFLASQLDLWVSYTYNGGERIHNTLGGPKVESAQEHVWLVRTTFSVHIGL